MSLMMGVSRVDFGGSLLKLVTNATRCSTVATDVKIRPLRSTNLFVKLLQ